MHTRGPSSPHNSPNVFTQTGTAPRTTSPRGSGTISTAEFIFIRRRRRLVRIRRGGAAAIKLRYALYRVHVQGHACNVGYIYWFIHCLNLQHKIFEIPDESTLHGVVVGLPVFILLFVLTCECSYFWNYLLSNCIKCNFFCCMIGS